VRVFWGVVVGSYDSNALSNVAVAI